MRTALVLLAILLTSDTARAVECHTEKGSSSSYWSWRIIAGKRCWYQGQPGMGKDKLQWPAPTEKVAADIAPPLRPRPVPTVIVEPVASSQEHVEAMFNTFFLDKTVIYNGSLADTDLRNRLRALGEWRLLQIQRGKP